jgi:hypothetical protein
VRRGLVKSNQPLMAFGTTRVKNLSTLLKMKKILLIALLFASCKKSIDRKPQQKCGYLTAKYLFEGSTPYFEIGEGQARFQVTEPEYDAHKVGDWYCY